MLYFIAMKPTVKDNICSFSLSFNECMVFFIVYKTNFSKLHISFEIKLYFGPLNNFCIGILGQLISFQGCPGPIFWHFSLLKYNETLCVFLTKDSVFLLISK